MIIELIYCKLVDFDLKAIFFMNIEIDFNDYFCNSTACQFVNFLVIDYFFVRYFIYLLGITTVQLLLLFVSVVILIINLCV